MTYFSVNLALENGTYYIELPDALRSYDNIVVRNASGDICALSTIEYAQVFAVYDFLHGLADGETIHSKLKNYADKMHAIEAEVEGDPHGDPQLSLLATINKARQAIERDISGIDAKDFEVFGNALLNAGLIAVLAAGAPATVPVLLAVGAAVGAFTAYSEDRDNAIALGLLNGALESLYKARPGYVETNEITLRLQNSDGSSVLTLADFSALEEASQLIESSVEYAAGLYQNAKNLGLEPLQGLIGELDVRYDIIEGLFSRSAFTNLLSFATEFTSALHRIIEQNGAIENAQEVAAELDNEMSALRDTGVLSAVNIGEYYGLARQHVTSGTSGTDIFIGSVDDDVFNGEGGNDVFNVGVGHDAVLNGSGELWVGGLILSGVATYSDVSQWQLGNYIVFAKSLSPFGEGDTGGITIVLDAGNSITLCDWSELNNYGVALEEKPGETTEGENLGAVASFTVLHEYRVPVLLSDNTYGYSYRSDIHQLTWDDFVLYASALDDARHAHNAPDLFGDLPPGARFNTYSATAVSFLPGALSGTENNDVLSGFGEGAEIHGLAGDDAISLQALPDFFSDFAPAEPTATVFGGDGDDAIDVKSAMRVVVHGDAGNDDVDGGYADDELYGDAGADKIRGNSGDDLIVGGAGPDDMDGGSGNDSYILTIGDGSTKLEASDVIDDAHGDDILILSGVSEQDVRVFENGYGTYQIAIFDPSAGWRYTRVEGVERIMTASGDIFDLSAFAGHMGGSDDDRIAGTDEAETMSGEDGDDILSAFAGNDILSGGAGRDQIDAGDGDDEVDGGADDDTIDAGEGNDTVFGGTGADRLAGGLGDDVIHGGADDDDIDAGDGNDVVFGDTGDDEVYAGVGADVVYGGAGNDWVSGDAGNDELYGGYGDDNLQGGEGDDLIDGGTGNDRLYGLTGSDTIFGGFGNDTVRAGDDADIAEGNEGDDYLYGEAGADQLLGGDGDDYVSGGDGDDRLEGDEGDDDLDGGLGHDTISGGTGADHIDGDEGDDFIEGNEGADWLIGGDGADSLFGGDGDDYVFGDAGNDLLHGGADNDALYGGDGDDELFGDAGWDRLEGGDGNDLLDPGSFLGTYAEVLHGGSGNDTYIYRGGFAYIEDTTGNDRIVFVEEIDWNRAKISLDYVSDYASFSFFDGAVSIGGLFVPDFAADANGHDGMESVEMANGEVKSLLDLAGLMSADVIGTDADETIEGSAFSDYLFGNGGNDVLIGGGGNDSLGGGEGNDTLDAGVGDNHLNGGAGDDTYVLTTPFGLNEISDESGIDTLSIQFDFSQYSFLALSLLEYGNATLHIYDENGQIGAVSFQEGFESIENVRLPDGNVVGLQSLIGQVPASIYGTPGDDSFAGTEYNDSLIGKGGEDTLFGLGGADYLRGGDGNDWLDGGEGVDQVYGDAGNDTLVISRYGLQGGEIYDGGDGRDLLEIYNYSFFAGVTFDLTAGEARSGSGQRLFTIRDIEDLAILNSDSASEETIFGTSVGNRLLAGNGNNAILGGAGDDTLRGNLGSDTLDGGTGTDTAVFSGSYYDYVIDLGAGTISGPDGADTFADIEFFEFDDGTLDVTTGVFDGPPPAVVTIEGTSGNDTISATVAPSGQPTATADGDLLYGRSGNDTLDGGPGADHMYGGAGDDTYKVDDAGDVVSEANETTGLDDGGYDRVRTSVSFVLPMFVERLILDGVADLDGTGNGIDNFLLGNDGSNALSGLEGADILKGGNGNDVVDGGTGEDKLYGDGGRDDLFGGAGDDLLNGGNGYDTLWGDADNDELRGAAGNDTLHGGEGADNLNGGLHDDMLYGDEGDDVLFGSKGNDTLDGGIGADKLKGNDGNDTLDGGADADTLYGGEGDDTLDGGDGADILLGGPGADVLFGGGDADRMWAGAGHDTLNGGEGNDRMNGDDGDDTLLGDGGDDWLYGRLDNDVLAGGDGKDYLEGGDGDDTLLGGAGFDKIVGGAGIDTIMLDLLFQDRPDQLRDFVSGEDLLGFSATELGLIVGNGLTAGGDLDAGYLSFGAAPSTGHAEFFFDAGREYLYFDADGITGDSIAVAELQGVTTLTASDFLIA